MNPSRPQVPRVGRPASGRGRAGERAYPRAAATWRRAAIVLAAMLAWQAGPPRAQARPSISDIDTRARTTAPQQPHPAVVRVIAPEGDSTSYGSGTLVDVQGDYGLVLTNWHVVCEATGTVVVVFPDGFRSAAKIVTTDRMWDLAALAIWKPNVAPVPLAPRPPQPGEPLTIAGYGSGTYRAATGHCTQYVAPGMNQPAEMVEVSIAARQGDSGGPIFNSRGELAGVLFGSGWGTTSGSYCGRVNMFLTAIMPRSTPGQESYLAARPAAPAQRLVPVSANAPPTAASSAADPHVILAEHQTTAAHAPLASTAASGPRNPAAQQGPQDAAATASATEVTLGQQIELVLALVGASAVLVHGLRLLLPAR
ncbi:MAG: trypsin-like peptidase domain-containing protein [Planctomycetia bacterium]|nr:trypsin-like peptidase domain-containing protein [Planctomycetia bacterium]